MQETATAHFHLDSPGPGQRLAAGQDTVRGWLVPKAGWHYTDLRLSTGSSRFAGIFGLPRADLAAYFQSPQPFLLAEFAIPVRLPPGPSVLTLEGCSSRGEWEKIADFAVESAAGAAPPAAENVPLRACEVGAAMWNLLRRQGTGSVPIETAVSELLDASPQPHLLRYPHLPFHGHLDEPWSWSQTVFGRLTVLGCLFHETQPIRRILATADLQAVHPLSQGLPSPDFARPYPAFAQAGACRFEGFVDVPAQLPQPFTLRIYAELADGSWHLGSVVRVTATDLEFAKQPLAPYSLWRFWRTWRCFRQAALARGYTLPSGPELRGELFRTWRQYRLQAPRPGPRTARARSRPAPEPGSRLGHLHLITHNLNREGAPLFLLEYAGAMRRETGCQLTLTSAGEGPLRAEFEALGAKVQVIDATPLEQATRPADLRRAIRALVPVTAVGTADLVVANTLAAYWGIPLAHAAGRPSLLYIHESTSPAAFFHGHLPPAVLPVVEESFRQADAVSFLTASTRRYYTALSDGSNYVVNPGWINLAAIEEFRRTHVREQERAALGLAPDRPLVVNVGTVCDRKGQHLFARAVDLLWRQAPALAAQADFRMIGGRDTAYDRDLDGFLRTLGRSNLQVVPETPHIYSYYAAADLFVCSSYEESFPRVVMEAMAFAVPIISTGVHGVPELTRPEQEAVLVPPGDTAALAAALQRLLADPGEGRRLAAAARARVGAEFAAQIVLPRHVALARAVAARQG